MRAAVVIARDVPVLESPVPMAEPLFHLPEAQIVTVSAEHDHFMLIKTSDDRTGWVADTNVAPVVPSRPIPQPTALTFKGRLSIH